MINENQITPGTLVVVPSPERLERYSVLDTASGHLVKGSINISRIRADELVAKFGGLVAAVKKRPFASPASVSAARQAGWESGYHAGHADGRSGVASRVSVAPIDRGAASGGGSVVAIGGSVAPIGGSAKNERGGGSQGE